MSAPAERRALVTGAASGLGKALALQLGRAGWRVALADLDLNAAREVAQQIGANAQVLALDVTQETDWHAAASQLQQNWGGVDLLINNAGVATAGTVEESSLEQWQWVLNINLLGCVRGCRAFIPMMKAQRSGHLVNIASFAGIANPPAMASYNAAKAAVISLSETLRFELAAEGVGVSVACPSFFKTALMATSQQRAPSGSLDSAPQMQRIVNRLMDSATVSADDVATDILRAVEQKRFMVITHADAKQRYHLKRLAPELYFRIARKVTAKFLQKR